MERKKVTISGPLKEVSDFISQSHLSAFEALVLASWLLTSFVNSNIVLSDNIDSSVENSNEVSNG